MYCGRLYAKMARGVVSELRSLPLNGVNRVAFTGALFEF